jgi:Fur family zinc uptake transcriptional regulator
MARSEAFCKANGARLTPIRRRVLELLHGADRPLGAYDLVDRLGSQGHRLAPITVYRALDFLIAQGFAHRLASRNAYIVSSDLSRAGSTTAFLICEACGDVSEVASPDVADTVLKVLREKGYQPRSRILEITGCCSRCRDVH